jgi:membrane-bound lytic murein transglycosylase
LITAVSVIDGADGTPVVAGQTVARSRSIIPGRGVLVDVDSVGTGLLANDTGGAIVGYRLDFYQGSGKAVCAGYTNPMGVSDCSPAQTKCPGSALQ